MQLVWSINNPMSVKGWGPPTEPQRGTWHILSFKVCRRAQSYLSTDLSSVPPDNGIVSFCCLKPPALRQIWAVTSIKCKGLDQCLNQGFSADQCGHECSIFVVFRIAFIWLAWHADSVFQLETNVSNATLTFLPVFSLENVPRSPFGFHQRSGWLKIQSRGKKTQNGELAWGPHQGLS